MLVLVGSGEYLAPMEPVDRYLLDQLPGEPNVVCLPTAAGSESPQRVAYWSELGVAYFSHLGVHVESLPVIDGKSANDPLLAGRIREANFVYLSGGRPTYLLNTLRGSPANNSPVKNGRGNTRGSTLAWQAIQQVLAAGGILAGCSAGAMILGERIPAFPVWQRAFNLLPEAVIVPHFDEMPESFSKTMKLFVSRDKVLVGVEGSTALLRQGQELQVLGRGGVTIWNRRERVRYTQGQIVRWPIDGGLAGNNPAED
jgi:cyanophycinase